MPDLDFFRAGCEQTGGLQAALVPIRRLFRRVLRPMFYRQVELYQAIFERLERIDARQSELRAELADLRTELAAAREDTRAVAKDLKALSAEVITLQETSEDHEERIEHIRDQTQTTLAFGWDYVAMVRRLAVLEDRVAGVSASSIRTADDAEGAPSILFPGLEDAVLEPSARERAAEIAAGAESRHQEAV